MRVKGTKQLGSFKRGINLYVPKKVVPQAEQVIWKVAVYGAGTTSSNGEYVWDGATLTNEKPQYSGPQGTQTQNSIYWDLDKWVIFDGTEEFTSYYSLNLISWEVFDGLPDVPSSALSYAQDSEIQSITLSGAGTTSVNGEYIWDGATIINEKPIYFFGTNAIYWIGFNCYLTSDYDTENASDLYSSVDLFNWTADGGNPDAPAVSTVVYSA